MINSLNPIRSESSLLSALFSRSPDVSTSTNDGEKTWADMAPRVLKPYIELTRIDLFVGSLMLFWPCTWGLTMTAQATNMPLFIYVRQLMLWLVWSIILHSVGCIWNDICDIDIDRQVERTKNRPLPSGRISVQNAFIWMSVQLLMLGVILYQFNPRTMYLGFVQIFLLSSGYPFLKRVTHFPQVWLGIAFNWCAILGWVSNMEPDWPVLALIVGAGTLWTTYSDTFYTMLDKKDDPKAGVKSTALLFGNKARVILAILAAVFVAGQIGIGQLANQGFWFYLFNVGMTSIHLTYQLATVNFDDPDSCMQKFLANGGRLGYILWFGYLAGYICQSK